MNKKYLYLIMTIAVCAIPILYFCNPTEHIWMPKCPTKAIFGIDCPGCGLQRSAHALLHGNLKEALGYNLFFVVAFPYLFIVLLSGIMKEGKLQQKIQKIVNSKYATYGYISIFFSWFVIRNILKL